MELAGCPGAELALTPHPHGFCRYRLPSHSVSLGSSLHPELQDMQNFNIQMNPFHNSWNKPLTVSPSHFLEQEKKSHFRKWEFPNSLKEELQQVTDEMFPVRLFCLALQ